MKKALLLIMAFVCFTLNAFELPKDNINAPNAGIADLWKTLRLELTKKKFNTKLLYEDHLKEKAPCSHCPKYMELTSQVNKILDELKKQPEVENAEVLTSVNDLKFLYYTVKSVQEDGKSKCNRFGDVTTDLKPTRLDGEMKLLARDVFKFDGITTLQVLNPKTEEITYYYRGTGDQSHIIVQAIISKEGGQLRYYHYYPTEEEKNPYNLPDLSGADKEEKVFSGYLQSIDSTSQVGNEENGKTTKNNTNEYDINFKPKLKNFEMGKAQITHHVSEGLKVKAESHFGLKGNDARIDVLNVNGEKMVEVSLVTKLNGKTEHKIHIPYSVNILEKNEVKIFGSIKEETEAQQITLALTDKYGAYFRSEVFKNKNLGTTRMSISRDVALSQKESMSISVGKSEDKLRYMSLTHTKAIKENVTVVMNVKIDENRKATFYYQLNAKF